MFNANNYIIDKVRRVTRSNSDGMVEFTLTSIENPQIQFTGESTDKTDAYGVLLARFDTAKGVSFSGEASMLSMPLMAAQLGTDVQVATEEKKLSGKTFEILSVADGKATMSYEPTTAPAYVYSMTQDKNINEAIKVGAEDGNASVSGKEITLPEGFAGTQVGVLYDYTTSAAVKVVDRSNEFAEAACYVVDVLAADVCNPAVKRHGFLVFPKAKIDNNFDINLTTEGTHPFSFTALKDYCSDDEELCYLLFHE